MASLEHTTSSANFIYCQRTTVYRLCHRCRQQTAVNAARDYSGKQSNTLGSNQHFKNRHGSGKAQTGYQRLRQKSKPRNNSKFKNQISRARHKGAW